jgi:beta-galactosidase
MATGETNRLDTTAGESCDLWADLIHLQDAEPLASYTDGFYAGTPAVTRNAFGEGAAYYLGTRPEERYTKSFLQSVCGEAGVRPTVEGPPGVEAVRRKTEAAYFLFLLNHNKGAVEVRLPNPGRDLLTGTEHGPNLVLDSLEVAILKERMMPDHG